MKTETLFSIFEILGDIFFQTTENYNNTKLPITILKTFIKELLEFYCILTINGT